MRRYSTSALEEEVPIEENGECCSPQSTLLIYNHAITLPIFEYPDFDE
jgi:hypothetical protein